MSFSKLAGLRAFGNPEVLAGLSPLVVVAWVMGCTGGDGDSDEPLALPPPGEPVVVVPHATGIAFFTQDGHVVAESEWSSLLADCEDCESQGASPDGNGLLVSFITTRQKGQVRPGGIARIRPSGPGATVDFQLEELAFPHDVVRDRVEGTLMVVETGADRVSWLPGAGESSVPLRTLGSAQGAFPNKPNGAEQLVVGESTYLLLTHRPLVRGRITLWDITMPGAPQLVWRFPADGSLGIPHGPILRNIDGQWWLVYAHTEGGPNGRGTVGLAVTDDPTVAPTYVADLVPGSDAGEFQFLRGVEVTDDLRLLATDSVSPYGNAPGRVVEAAWPDLEPSAEASGAVGDQVFVGLGPATPWSQRLVSPFEGWLWRTPWEP